MANGLGSFSIGMDPRPFLAQRGMQIQNRRIVPIPGFLQPAMPTPPPVAQPVAQPTPPPVAPPIAQPTPQPTPQPMIPQPQPALPSEQLNIQPPMGIPTTPPVQEPPPMAPPVMEQPPMAPPMAPPVMDQSDNDFARSFFGRLRDSGVNFPERPVASPGDNMMRPTPLLPPSDNMTQPEFRFNNPRLDIDAPTRPLRPDIRLPDIERPFRGFGLDGILGGFDRFRPPPPPRFGLPDRFRPNLRPFPPGFGESPMRDFRGIRGIGLRNPFFGPRRQG